MLQKKVTAQHPVRFEGFPRGKKCDSTLGMSQRPDLSKLTSDERDALIYALLARVGELERRLGLDSSDSGQPPQSRQIGWAHLRREVQALIDRGGAGAAVGESVLGQAAVLCGWGPWGRAGTWAPAPVQGARRWLRGAVPQALAAGARGACPQTAATCQELLTGEPALWTFARGPGLAPLL
jgi:hypothetical protein